MFSEWVNDFWLVYCHCGGNEENVLNQSTQLSWVLKCLPTLFKKFHFIDYAITVVPLFPLCPSPPNSPTPSGNPHLIAHVHWSCICVLWLLYFLCCTLHAHDYSVTINLYFLIPSPFSPTPRLPCCLTTIKMFSVYMILFPFCLFVSFVF